MAHEHRFQALITWTGAAQGPAESYKSYSREYRVQIEGKGDLTASAAAAFYGDAALYNPEDLLLAAISGCHLLSYLAIAVRQGVVVTSYTDEATATMTMKDGKMRFVEATLRPRVTITADSDPEKAMRMHHRASQECFIASSVNFPVSHEPEIIQNP
jgi:organic hydroperoxide reductase OsmC/OhrA